MKVFKITMPIAMSLFFLGCASKYFEEAVEKDTVYAYKSFLEEYGDSDYAYQVKEKLSILMAYNTAKSRDTIAGYNYFLSAYGSSKYAYEVTKRRDYLEKQKYINNLTSKIKNSNSAIDQAIIMNRYMYNKYSNDIKSDYFLKKYYENAIGCFRTTRDIILIDKKTEWKDLLFVDKRIDYIYAGKVFQGDIIYKDGDYISTLHSYKDLKKIYTNHSEWNDKDGIIKEAFGSMAEFKKENKLSNEDLFQSVFYSVTAKEFIPTKYIQTTSSLEGALIDFVEENPLTSLAIGAGVATMLNSSSDNSSFSASTSSDSSSSNYDVTADPEMTRWEQRYCSSCGKSTRHKVGRHEHGSSKADYQCKVCGDGYAGSW